MVQGKKIFIAEDDRESCEMYQMALGPEGYQIRFAHTGKAALDKLTGEKPDLVILDVMMPEMDGYEVCRRLRQLPDFVLTPVIMLTALSTDEDKIRGYDVGADDYITKPVSLRLLRARVRSILERSAPRTAQTIPAAKRRANAFRGPVGASALLQPVENFLAELLGAAVPSGSNILIVGPLASGKSSFARFFVTQALQNGAPSMFVCVDDEPDRVRDHLKSKNHLDVSLCEKRKQLCFVDAYSWSTGKAASAERFAITDGLELSDLSLLISRAAAELGQTEAEKAGGRRVIDSLSTLFANFELPHVQRFVAFLVRSGYFAGVSTIFLLDEGACSGPAIKDIREMMDAVVEFKAERDRFLGRIQATKWAARKSEWTDVTLS